MSANINIVPFCGRIAIFGEIEFISTRTIFNFHFPRLSIANLIKNIPRKHPIDVPDIRQNFSPGQI